MDNPLDRYGKELGKAFVGLTSGDKDTRLACYVMTHAIRRHFTEKQWETLIERMDVLRSQTGHKPINYMLDSIKEELIYLNPQKKEPFMAKTAQITQSSEAEAKEPDPFVLMTQGFRMIADGLMRLSAKMQVTYAGQPFKEAGGSQISQSCQETPPTAEPVAEPVAETVTETAVPSNTPPAETTTIPDYKALREDCRSLIASVGRTSGIVKVKSVFDELKIEGGITKVPDEKLAGLRTTLQNALKG